jgi:ABC-type multidrug transport system ATPase subunit
MNISSHIFSTLSETCDKIHLLRKGEQIKSVQKSGFKSLEQERKEITIGNRMVWTNSNLVKSAVIKKNLSRLRTDF